MAVSVSNSYVKKFQDKSSANKKAKPIGQVDGNLNIAPKAALSGNIASRVTNEPVNSGATATGTANTNAPGTTATDIMGSPQTMIQSGNQQINGTGMEGRYSVLKEINNMGQTALDTSTAQLQAAQATQQRVASQARQDYAGALEGFNYNVEGGTSGGAFNGAGLDGEQQKNAQQIIGIGRSRGLNDNDIQIALMTALTESGLRNLNHGDRDSVGLFQQRTSQGWGSLQQIMNPNYSINKFYDTYDSMARNRNDLSPWMRAQTVQRSFDPTGSNFRAQYEKAKQILSGGGAASQNATPGQKNAASSFINQYNNKYIDFDRAYGNQCVDLFNYYNQGFVGGGFIGGVNGAKDIWSSRQMDQNYQRLNASARPAMGDVMVWGQSMGGGYGHVAVVVGYNSNGTVRVLHSNATAAGSRGNTVISNMSRNGLLGYFRPKKLGR